MTKYELVKETRIDGQVQYSIEKDGKYVSRSVCETLEEAERYLNALTNGGSLEALKETIKTIELDED